MATIGTKYNLRDIASTQDDSGRMLPVVDVLMKQQEMLQYLAFTPSNQDMSHLVSNQTYRPSGQRGRFNKGVTFSKATAKKLRDPVSLLTEMARVDTRFFSAGLTSPAEWRFSQEKPIMHGMADTVATDLMYGDELSDEDEMNGILTRYDNLPTDPYDQDDPNYNVLDAGGTGSTNTSIVLARFAPDAVHGLYPKNGIAGLDSKDMGEQVMGDDTNGYITYMVTQYQWFYGLTVEDWRQCVAIRNIDVPSLVAGTGADLFDLMMEAAERLPQKDNAFFIMHRRVSARLAVQQRLRQEQYQIDGTDRYVPMDSVGGIPVLRSDALLLTESAIS